MASNQDKPRVLFAWELGSNYGHAGEVAAVARHLMNDCDLYVAAQNVPAMRALGADLNMKLIAAPYVPARTSFVSSGVGRNFSDILRTCGWSSVEELSALIEAWRNLYTLIQPDLIVSQTAPTALLAARGLDVKTAMYGSGYNCPPRRNPMPPFYHWEDDADCGIAAIEADALSLANAVLKQFEVPEMTEFCDFLQCDSYLVTTLPALDHYAPREQFEPNFGGYVGHLAITDQGQERDWRDDAEHKIFAYLRPNTPTFEAGIRALARLDPAKCHVILSAPGITDGLRDRLKGTAIDVVNGPVRLDRLLRDCSVMIHHSSNGTSCAALLAGIPQLGLPNHTEQTMCAHSLAKAKVGLALVGKFGPDDVLENLQKVLQTPAFREHAKQHSKDTKERYPEDPGKAVAEKLLELLSP